MARARISIITPYVLTEAEIDATLGALTPSAEAAIAALLKMDADDWRAQPDRIKVRQVVNFQASALLAASLAGAAAAHQRLEDAAFPTVSRTDDDLAAAVELLVEQALVKRAGGGVK